MTRPWSPTTPPTTPLRPLEPKIWEVATPQPPRIDAYVLVSGLIALFCASGVIRQLCAFSVAGPTAWNSLQVALRLTPIACSALFLSGLKTTLFDRGWTGNAPE